MTLKIISKRTLIEHTEYTRDFLIVGGQGGFSFGCDRNGDVNRNKMTTEAIANLEKCLSGHHHVEDMGVSRQEFSQWQPAEGRCDCGETVYLTAWTNTCSCGADYNMSGDELAPREQWGEETGESLFEILSAGR